MDPHKQSLDSTRLSMALVDLPLTPFGMKAPASQKRDNNCGRPLSKLSRQNNPSSLQKNKNAIYSNKENLGQDFGLNFTNVTRHRGKDHTPNVLTPTTCHSTDPHESDLVEGPLIEDDSIDIRATLRSKYVPYEPRDSIYTDIDEDGSFVEFICDAKKYVFKEPKPSFYTCNENDETSHSTSSKLPLARVGFRKFVDTYRNERRLKEIVEDVEESSLNDFAPNHTIIAGSGSIIKTIRPKNLEFLNSTSRGAHEHPLFYPDISSLTLEADQTVNVEGVSSPINVISGQTNSSKECIIISESSGDELADTITHSAEILERKPVNRSPMPSIPNSFVTDDVDVAPSRFGETELHLNDRFAVCQSRGVGSDLNARRAPVTSKNFIENMPGNSNSESGDKKTTKVLDWVLSSPFVDGSFSSSFMNGKDHTQDTSKCASLNSKESRQFCLRLSGSTSIDSINYSPKHLGESSSSRVAPSSPLETKPRPPIGVYKTAQACKKDLPSCSNVNTHASLGSPRSCQSRTILAKKPPANAEESLKRKLTFALSPDKDSDDASLILSSEGDSLHEDDLPAATVKEVNPDEEDSFIITRKNKLYPNIISSSDDSEYDQYCKERSRILGDQNFVSKENLPVNTIKKVSPDEEDSLIITRKNKLYPNIISSSDDSEYDQYCKERSRVLEGQNLMSKDAVAESESSSTSECESNLRRQSSNGTNKKTSNFEDCHNDKNGTDFSASSEDINEPFVPKSILLSSDDSSEEEVVRRRKLHKRKKSRKALKNIILTTDDKCELPETETVCVRRPDNSDKAKKHTDGKWRAPIVTIISSDSEEENLGTKKGGSSAANNKLLKYLTPRKPRTPKMPAYTPTALCRPPIEKPKQLSFLASLSTNSDRNCSLHPEASVYLKNFKRHKTDLVNKLYKLFNKDVFDNRLPENMKINWNPRLTKTAGFCSLKRDLHHDSRRSAHIELSVKVLDCCARLRDTLIHEMCHAGAWIISGVRGGHGRPWKAWAYRAMRVFPELPPISRCHSYNIAYKYIYRCTNCGLSYGRHSKSIDIQRKVCGQCQSKLELLINAPSTPSKGGVTDPLPKTPRTPGPFAIFVKENYGSIKSSQKNLKHADVMKELGEKFRQLKTQ